jgi:hypothetical protein
MHLLGCEKRRECKAASIVVEIRIDEEEELEKS